jgi:hypothetical protein
MLRGEAHPPINRKTRVVLVDVLVSLCLIEVMEGVKVNPNPDSP